MCSNTELTKPENGMGSKETIVFGTSADMTYGRIDGTTHGLLFEASIPREDLSEIVSQLLSIVLHRYRECVGRMVCIYRL
jgi:hypothetical protein